MSSPLALPFVLRRDKSRTDEISHEEWLFAAFVHMANLMERRLQGSLPSELWSQRWTEWERGKFRKIVKRATPQKFDQLASEDDAVHTLLELPGGPLELLSLPPYHLDEPDLRVKPLQVSGLNYEPIGDYGSTVVSHTNAEDPEGVALYEGDFAPKGNPALVVAYDGLLGASTGKLMAQAGHAAQLLKRKVSSWNLASTPIEIVDSFEADGVTWLLEVRDSGFTEIAPDSITIKVGIRQ